MTSDTYQGVKRQHKFRFGVFSDVQYADCDDGFNFSKTKRRFYRHALVHMDSALKAWKAFSDEPCIDAVLNLGDTLDGRCSRCGITQSALHSLQSRFDQLQVPIHHVVGNHELYNIQRNDILQSVLFRNVVDRLPSEALSQKNVFYDFIPLGGFRMVILDSFDVSSIGLDKDDERFLSADALLRSKNPNEDLNDHRGLEEPHFVEYNGGIGAQQMEWLERVLVRSSSVLEYVIIVSHVPMDICCSDECNLLWNFQQVGGLVQRFPHVVKLVLCGHVHNYRTGYDDAGIPHLAMPALLETPPGENGAAILELNQNCIRIISDGGIVFNSEIAL